MRHLILIGCAAVLSFPLPSAGESPAEERIRASLAQVEHAPSERERATVWLSLAAAHTARARETGDSGEYERALEALGQAHNADPACDACSKVEAWVRLGRHEFAAAEALVRARVQSHPDDHESWGLLGDARMELGQTEAAGDAYQRMMDLRPGPGAYLRAAFWAESVGRLEEALGLLARTLAATSDREREQLAWIHVRMASVHGRLGQQERAEASLVRALSLFPGYHYALAGLAEHELRRGRSEEALGWAQRALEAAPHPEIWLLLADALRNLGRDAEARSAEDAFERAALANVGEPDNENVFLVDFFLDRRPDPARALEIARIEAQRRPDRATLERLERAIRHSGAPLQLR
jgi:tetratricopeptide (TPR) repeat protein